MVSRVVCSILAIAMVAISGCDGGGLVLGVDLRTDYVPELEFDEVRTEMSPRLDGGLITRQSQELGVTRATDVFSGARVAEFGLDGVGARIVTVSLLFRGSLVAERTVQVTVTRSQSATVLITRSCAGVTCPLPDGDASLTSCLGGACVSPECLPESPEACSVACAADDECSATAACAEGRCVGGFCLVMGIAGACSSTEWCDVERGCTPLPGEECVPETEACNSRDDDCDELVDEGFDLDADLDHCGACGNVCAGVHATAACTAGACELGCDDGWADCNAETSDGCEADLTSPTACGACTTTCSAPTPLCVRTADAFVCASECPPEAPTLCGGSCVDTGTSLVHCGGCGAACDPAHATAECSGGTCRIASCDPGWDDCDTDLGTGCEANLSSPGTCGACGTSCPPARPFCVGSGGGFACTDGCSDGARGGDETDVDCGGALCPACPSGSSCASTRDCAGFLVCSAGRCVACGECEPGAVDGQACGMCGTQTRTCQPTCVWGSFGTCMAGGACAPGAVEMGSCGNCGTRSRTCGMDCNWGAWTGCGGEGVCAPSATRSVGCGNCGTQLQTCTSSCAWGDTGGCAGEGVCSPGTVDGSGCPGTCMTRSCTAGCSYPTECNGCSASCTSSVNQCGTSCPSGYYPSSRQCTTSCGGTSCISAPDNQVSCRRACGTSFTQCGLSCPTGYYSSSQTCSTSCTSASSCISAPDNQASCALVQGTSFTQCGLTCPAGYYPSSYSCSTSCTSGSSCISAPDNQASCRRIEGTTFTMCGSSCPAGYAVTSRQCSTSCTSASSCISAPDNQVSCRLL